MIGTRLCGFAIGDHSSSGSSRLSFIVLLFGSYEHSERDLHLWCG